MKTRSIEQIQENIKVLESALEGYREEFVFVEKLRDRYFLKYDDDRESQIITDSLYSYMCELAEQISQTLSVLKKEREKLEKENRN